MWPASISDPLEGGKPSTAVRSSGGSQLVESGVRNVFGDYKVPVDNKCSPTLATFTIKLKTFLLSCLC